jgi:predicted AAA+ superfamily ATPase
MNIDRAIEPSIARDLGEKIVMIGGPRQVGKTTLAKSYLTKNEQYFSWDDLKDREKIRKHEIDPTLGTVVLDEVHKYRRWRTLLKGLYDKYQSTLRIIVTGSARLDHFRKGGDSLFGRFFYYRLHPLTLSEVQGDSDPARVIERLLRFGGFPEPYVKSDRVFHRRWMRERLSRVVYQDIQDLSLVKEISLIEILIDQLPARVGALLSIKSLQEDLEVSPNTVKKWIELLELVYYCYRILPYGSKKIRAVKKATKLYLWDWSQLVDEGAKFENFVASHLLKYCHYREDTEGVKVELRYLRDIDGREIDFLVLEDSKPLFAVECKTGEKALSKHLRYFADRLAIPRLYQVHLGSKRLQDGKIVMLPFSDFCVREKLP